MIQEHPTDRCRSSQFQRRFQRFHEDNSKVLLELAAVRAEVKKIWGQQLLSQQKKLEPSSGGQDSGTKNKNSAIIDWNIFVVHKGCEIFKISKGILFKPRKN